MLNRCPDSLLMQIKLGRNQFHCSESEGAAGALVSLSTCDIATIHPPHLTPPGVNFQLKIKDWDLKQINQAVLYNQLLTGSSGRSKTKENQYFLWRKAHKSFKKRRLKQAKHIMERPSPHHLLKPPVGQCFRKKSRIIMMCTARLSNCSKNNQFSNS